MQPITLITLAQSIIIAAGTLFTAAFRRMRIEILLGGESSYEPPLEAAISNFGLFLLVIPLLWLVLYWRVSRGPRSRAYQGPVFWAGMAIAVGLFVFFVMHMNFPLHFSSLAS